MVDLGHGRRQMDDQLSNLFQQAAQLTDVDSQRVQEIVREQVASALAALPPAAGTGCLFADMATFLTRAVCLLAQISKGVSDGPHIKTYTKERVIHMKSENDFSELDPLFELNQRHKSLREISARLRLVADSIDAENFTPGNSQDPPIPETQGTVPPLNFEADTQAVSRQRTSYSSSHVSLGHEESFERDTDNFTLSEHDQDSIVSGAMAHDAPPDMYAALSVRGKGQYVCPHGSHCQKGGFKDGAPVVFYRNCTFKNHMQKHDKPFACPSCERAFGRADHLRRHQENVHG